MRGNPSVDAKYLQDILFQFTPLREGQLQKHGIPKKESPFQFTPLREGQPLHHFSVLPGLVFQFTPLREGQPVLIATGRLSVPISIHAPA